MQIEVVGCQGTIEIKDFISNLKNFSIQQRVAAQALYAPFVYGQEHVISAVEHAVRSFCNSTNTSNSLNMEILLYVAGCRQIRDAIDTLGIRSGEPMVVVAVANNLILNCDGFFGKDLLRQFLIGQNLCMDPLVIEGDERALVHFGVTSAELATVDKSMYGDLILERVALVDLIT